MIDFIIKIWVVNSSMNEEIEQLLMKYKIYWTIWIDET